MSQSKWWLRAAKWSARDGDVTMNDTRFLTPVILTDLCATRDILIYCAVGVFWSDQDQNACMEVQSFEKIKGALNLSLS